MLKFLADPGHFLVVAGAIILIIFSGISLFSSPPNPQQPMIFMVIGGALIVAGIIVIAVRRYRRR